MKANCWVVLHILFVAIVLSCSSKQASKSAVPEKPAPPPNIIFIMTDDHAKNAISLYGSELLKTPNIDRIGKEGIVFNRAFVTNSLCGPSRAVALTGKFSHINGFRHNRDTFDGSQETFPKMLQKKGYFTSIIGKWHLRSVPQGFDYWNILIGQGAYYNPKFVAMGDTTVVEGYTTDIITDITVETIENRVGEGQPFCILMHQKAPHRAWMPNIKDLVPGDSMKYPLPETFYDDYSTRSAAASEQDMEIKNLYHSLDMKLYMGEDEVEPGSGGSKGFDAKTSWKLKYARLTEQQRLAWDAFYKPISDAFYQAKPEGKDLEEWMYQRYIFDYLKTIKSVDDNVGRLLNYLESKNLLENTLIVYTSDQGFFLGEHGWYDKRFMYEPSCSTPLLMRYPKLIPKGSQTNKLVQNVDYAPTLLDVSQTAIPDSMQGISLTSLFNQPDISDWRDAIYYHYYEYPFGWHDVKRHYGIRTDRYKLIHFYEDIDAWELYDLETDPNEVNNLYQNPEYAVLKEELKNKLENLRIEYGDTAPIKEIEK